jgi:SAM-dependent methyltransferase
MTMREKMLVNCVICGYRLEPHFKAVRDPITQETFSIFRCMHCRLGHTVPQPEDLDRYYQESYYGNRHGFTSSFCVKRRLRFVAAAEPDGCGKRLLDIGCGDGSFLLAARKAGWNVMGTERSPVSARGAGLDVEESLDRVTASGTFDCITMWHTLEHMRDIPYTLSTIARLLKPDGKLMIAVPDSGGIQAFVFGPNWLHTDVPRHLYHFDSKALSHCIDAAGFTVRQQWHQEFEYDLLGWSQSILNLLLPLPNVFFDSLRGRKGRAGRFTRFCGFLLGLLLTVVSLPALVLGTLTGRGGTLIVIAVRPMNEADSMRKR